MLRNFLVSICQKLIGIIQDLSVELMVSDMTLHAGEGVQILVDGGIEVKCLLLIRQKELFEGTDESAVERVGAGNTLLFGIIGFHIGQNCLLFY